MEAYFKGSKELFEGLAIEGLEKDWTEYPVLHLDLNGSKYMNPEDLDDILNMHLDRWESEYGVPKRYNTLSVRFQAVIDAAYGKTANKLSSSLMNTTSL